MKLTSSYITSNGTKLHTYRTGGNKPALVLVHGITDDGLCWTPVANALSDQYDVVMVDQRGHGKSEAPENGYTMANLAADLAGLINGLELQKPLILGHSLGASASLVLAGLFPELPGAILLEDPPAFWDMERASSEDVHARKGLAEWINGLKRKTCNDLFAEVRTMNPGWSEEEIGPWVDSKQRFSPRIAELVIPSGKDSLDYPALMQRIICPVLVIYADPESGAILTEENLATLKGWIPHLRAAHISGAGHNIRREQFAQYMEIVLRALRDYQDPEKRALLSKPSIT